MDVSLDNILIADRTKELLWEQGHSLCYNTRTKEKMSLESFLLIFNRKFKNLKDIPTITEILRLNKKVTEEYTEEFKRLVAWHTRMEPQPELPAPPAYTSGHIKIQEERPVMVEEDDEWESDSISEDMWEEDDDDNGDAKYTPSYPGQKSFGSF